MGTPAQFEWRVPRWQPYDDTFVVRGLDLTGGTFTLEVRSSKDAPGSALLALGNASPTAQGLSVSVATVDGLPVSTIRVIITESTINGLAAYPDNGLNPNVDAQLHYCLKFSTSGLPKQRLIEGILVLLGGANKA